MSNPESRKSLAGLELEPLWLPAWPTYKQLVQENPTSFKGKNSKGSWLKATTAIQELKKKKEQKQKGQMKNTHQKKYCYKEDENHDKTLCHGFKNLNESIYL